MSGKKLTDQLKEAPKFDGLAVGALALNAFAIYNSQRRIEVNELLELFPSEEITLIQVSIGMAAIYLVEMVGDEGGSRGIRSHSSGSDGLIGWLSGFMEHGSIGTAVDGASLVSVFFGYQYLSSNAPRGASLFDISTEPVIVAMQLSVLMMINFGLFLLGDLMSRGSK